MPFVPLSRRAALGLPGAAAAAALAGCRRPKATAFPGFALVANQGSRTVAVVDLSRFRVRARVPVEGAPGQMLAHPTRPAALVLVPHAGAVTEIVPGRIKDHRTVRVCAEAVCMRPAPDGRSVWVLCREPASLVELSLDTLRPGRRIRLAPDPVDCDLSRDGLAAVCFRNQAAVTLADPRGGLRTVATTAPVSLVRFQSDGKQLLAAHSSSRALTIADVASGRVVVRLTISLAPRNFCFSADGGQLFITGEGADAVAIVYPYNTEVAETLLAGRAPDGMAASTAPPYLFVTNPETGGITVLDIDTRKLVAVVNTGGEPRSVVITPDNQYALVLNQGSGDLAVVRISALAARRYKHAPLFNLIPVGDRPVSAVVIQTA